MRPIFKDFSVRLNNKEIDIRQICSFNGNNFAVMRKSAFFDQIIIPARSMLPSITPAFPPFPPFIDARTADIISLYIIQKDVIVNALFQCRRQIKRSAISHSSY